MRLLIFLGLKIVEILCVCAAACLIAWTTWFVMTYLSQDTWDWIKLFFKAFIIGAWLIIVGCGLWAFICWNWDKAGEYKICLKEWRAKRRGQ